ncbi:glycosyltransferase family 39 protein [Roseibium sp. CAU 1637]|uniref:Glycosyltransferase family 39 protein n=1 Tax=Roseibium limicola TaxID=2816037 RepID=A0A939ENX0_9HYPH|nr:glycosyltransferase family 39 protein [Roseibium limicola]
MTDLGQQPKDLREQREPASLPDLPLFLRPGGLVALVLALAVLKVWAAANSHLVEDEAYYRLWGLHPALGYYDHPPMIAWWIWAGQQLLGDTVLAVRAAVILSSVLGSLVLWRTGLLLFGARAAGWAVLFFNASLLIGIGGILATPDAPSVLFWGLAFWALVELQTSENANWWLAVGLFAGLGLVSKYSCLFLGTGILLWLVWVPTARKWFGTWQLWAGGLLAVYIFAPVLYWNQLHDWVSFYKQFGRAGSGALTSKYIFEFIGAVFGLMNPLVALPACLGAALLSRGTWGKQAGSALVIVTVLPFLAYLIFHSLHARVQANWPAPLFPAFALMAGMFVARASTASRFWRIWATGAVVSGLVIAVVVQIHAVAPLTGVLARKDPTFQLRGWPEVGRQIEQIAEAEDAHFVLTSSYGLTGHLDFLLKGHTAVSQAPVSQVNERIRYIMAPQTSSESFGGTGLYVTTNRRDRSALLLDRFADVRLIAEFPRQVRGVELEQMRVYRMSDPTGSVLDPVETRQPTG